MFWFALRLVLAAGTIFVILNITTPVVYSVWYDNLRDDVTFGNLQTTGDIFFGNFHIDFEKVYSTKRDLGKINNEGFGFCLL